MEISKSLLYEKCVLEEVKDYEPTPAPLDVPQVTLVEEVIAQDLMKSPLVQLKPIPKQTVVEFPRTSPAPNQLPFCKCLIQSGARKGELCGRAVAQGSERCNLHKTTCILPEQQVEQPPIPQESKCMCIIQSGKQKGAICGRPVKQNGRCNVHKTTCVVGEEQLSEPPIRPPPIPQESKCMCIIQSGKQKGAICGRPVKQNGRCNVHKTTCVLEKVIADEKEDIVDTVVQAITPVLPVALPPQPQQLTTTQTMTIQEITTLLRDLRPDTLADFRLYEIDRAIQSALETKMNNNDEYAIPFSKQIWQRLFQMDDARLRVSQVSIQRHTNLTALNEIVSMMPRPDTVCIVGATEQLVQLMSSLSRNVVVYEPNPKQFAILQHNIRTIFQLPNVSIVSDYTDDPVDWLVINQQQLNVSTQHANVVISQTFTPNAKGPYGDFWIS